MTGSDCAEVDGCRARRHPEHRRRDGEKGEVVPGDDAEDARQRDFESKSREGNKERPGVNVHAAAPSATGQAPGSQVVSCVLSLAWTASTTI